MGWITKNQFSDKLKQELNDNSNKIVLIDQKVTNLNDRVTNIEAGGNLADIINQINNMNTDLNNKINNLTNDLTTVNNNVNNRIDLLTTTVTNIDNRVSNMDTQITNIISNLDENTTIINNYFEEIDTTKYKKNVLTTDEYGSPTSMEYRRKEDNTLAIISEASLPDEYGYYTQLVCKYYSEDGTTLEKTITYHFTFLENGLIATSDGGVET